MTTKLRTKIKVSPSLVEEFIQLLRQECELVEAEPLPVTVCRDPDDREILGLICPGQVACVITGNKDLLVLEAFHGCRILTPRAFWEVNRRSGQD